MAEQSDRYSGRLSRLPGRNGQFLLVLVGPRFGEVLSVKLICSLGKLLVLLVRARSLVSPHALTDDQGLMSYEELIEEIERLDGYAPNRTSVIEYLSRIWRAVRNEARQQGLELDELFVREGGAVRIAGIFDIRLDESVEEKPRDTPGVRDNTDDPVLQGRISEVRKQLINREGPFFEALKDLL